MSTPVGGASRRGFLFTMGAITLGRYFTPPPPSGIAPTPAVAGPVAERVRRLLVEPSWGAEGRFLLWTEVPDDGGEPDILIWEIETNQERAEADRFYKAATWQRWRTPNELRHLLRVPGPWLIRRNSMGEFSFFSTLDPAILFGDENGDATITTDDPVQAARVTTAQALELIPRLSVDYGGMPSLYLEPVKPEDALRDFRAEAFA